MAASPSRQRSLRSASDAAGHAMALHLIRCCHAMSTPSDSRPARQERMREQARRRSEPASEGATGRCAVRSSKCSSMRLPPPQATAPRFPASRCSLHRCPGLRGRAGAAAGHCAAAAARSESPAALHAHSNSLHAGSKSDSEPSASHFGFGFGAEGHGCRFAVCRPRLAAPDREAAGPLNAAAALLALPGR